MPAFRAFRASWYSAGVLALMLMQIVLVKRGHVADGVGDALFDNVAHVGVGHARKHLDPLECRGGEPDCRLRQVAFLLDEYRTTVLIFQNELFHF